MLKSLINKQISKQLLKKNKMKTEEELNASLKTVNITIVIDTDKLITNFSSPSQDKDTPTAIDHSYAYMVATSAAVISGAGTGDLVVKANIGDTIAWTGISESNNFDSSVLIYKVYYNKGASQPTTPVFSNDTRFKVYNKSAGILPTQDTVFPVALNNGRKSWFLKADITDIGTENYITCFAVYKRDDDSNLSLYGYFCWDPAIVVNQ